MLYPLYLYSMQALYNHGGELITYHYQNMLLHPDNFKVLGLVLGNCVFDAQAKIIGKLFQQKVYNLSGEVLASQSDVSMPLPSNFSTANCVVHAWRILVQIKDHDCPWVTVKEKWSQTSLAEYLYAYMTALA